MPHTAPARRGSCRVCTRCGEKGGDALSSGEKGFVHMGAVAEDHGVWEDPADYFASDRYVRLNTIQMMGYPMLALLANRNIERIRTT